MEVRKFFKRAKDYINIHPFHIVITSVMVAMCVMHVSHYTTIALVYDITQKNNDEISKHKSVYLLNRATDRREFADAIEAKGAEFAEHIEQVKLETSSKIDILNSAIEPEDKKRILVVKIREAILENTNTQLNVRELNNIAIAVIDYSYHYNLSIAKVLGQIRQESNFVIDARSPANAQGLMQVIPETWEYVVLKEFERKGADPNNIYHNIRAGCFYMSEQLVKFGNYDDALRAYNWGPDRVRRFNAGEISENNVPQETKEYVEAVNKWSLVFERYGLE